jgi:hypothetical protein
MKKSAEGGFPSGKWMYGRGSIVGVLNAALLENELQPGQDVLVVLVDEFGFTSKASLDVGGGSGISVSPRKAGATEQGKVRNPFTYSPVSSPAKRPTEPRSSGNVARNGKANGMETAVDDGASERATQLSSPARLGSPDLVGSQTERQQGQNSQYIFLQV